MPLERMEPIAVFRSSSGDFDVDIFASIDPSRALYDLGLNLSHVLLHHRIQLRNKVFLNFIILPTIAVASISIYENIILVLLINERSGVRAKVAHGTAVRGSNLTRLVSILTFIWKH
jgi:hypothetical protein